MKDKFLLLIVGSVVGIGLGLGAGYGLLKARGKLVEMKPGASYETPDDLRKAIVQRDERDVKADKSVSFRSIIEPHPSDSIIYDLKPNLDVKFQKVPVRTNSFGMRGPEITLEKPENTYRIALLGDSFAFGWGVREEDSFARVLERLLNERTGGNPKVEVLNFGVPGYSTFQEVSKHLEKGHTFDPDAILVYYVDNDMGVPFFIRNFKVEGTELTGSSRFNKLREDENPEVRKKSEELVGKLNPSRQLVVLLDFAKKNGQKVFISINPRRGWKADQRRLWVLEQRKDLNHIVIRHEFLRLLKERNIDPKELRLVGDPHPNGVGHGLLGEILADGFIKEIRPDSSS